jgi:exodeoxyribonuclease VII small subunit
MENNIKFETALESLEEKVRLLESGNISLDESLKAFEEAVALVRVCNDRLAEAERRVRILTEGKDGTVTDMPFEDSVNEA